MAITRAAAERMEAQFKKELTGLAGQWMLQLDNYAFDEMIQNQSVHLLLVDERDMLEIGLIPVSQKDFFQLLPDKSFPSGRDALTAPLQQAVEFFDQWSEVLKKAFPCIEVTLDVPIEEYLYNNLDEAEDLDRLNMPSLKVALNQLDALWTRQNMELDDLLPDEAIARIKKAAAEPPLRPSWRQLPPQI